MPIHEWGCRDCGRVIERLVPSRRRLPEKQPCTCGSSMGLLVSSFSFRSFESYVTPHITGKPIEVTDRAQERRLLRSHGLVKMDKEIKWNRFDTVSGEQPKAKHRVNRVTEAEAMALHDQAKRTNFGRQRGA